MKQEFYFKHAKWVGAPERTTSTFSVLRGRFTIDDIGAVSLNILGLGFFKCYVNGTCINSDTFLPLSSDYEASCDPIDETLSGHRIYVPSFDITPFVKPGENVIAIHFGGGWYTLARRAFGLPKAIYCISATSGEKTECFVSDESCRIGGSFVEDYNFEKFECHNYLDVQDCFAADFDDSGWENAAVTEPLETEYCSTDCPRDAAVATLSVTRIGKGEGVVYDCGQNTTGYPVLEINARAGERVIVNFSEEATDDGGLESRHMHRQRYEIVSDGTKRTVQPEFTWFGFRYFEVIGDATPIGVKVVRADIERSSTFECDNETLNWAYNTFIHTMLCNIHTGHPSDCPHLERRGYTGDGQLTCHAVLSVLDARALYEKWLQDIADSQDLHSGHVQYTAPYIRSGGGPGGWGCAIVEVPYQLYKHYGDETVLSKYYHNMRRYIDYLEAHSEFGLVTSDKAGQWCLGDWCGPNILYPDRDITSHNQQVILPAPMVNTYFMVKSLKRMCEIARVIGREDDIPEYEEKIDTRRRAIQAAYFNTFDGNFVMNVQGANAYAADLGLGDSTTYPNMVRYYQKLGYYDTGIFATDILTRLLFERGDCDLAVDLLTHDGDQGFEHWRRLGATTFHEYWDSNRSRSHSHPMFGAPIAYFFEYLLGIKQAPDSAGYACFTVAPQAVERFGWMRGSMTVPAGEVSVEYEKTPDGTRFCVTIPEDVTATFRYADVETPLSAGENIIKVADSEKFDV